MVQSIFQFIGRLWHRTPWKVVLLLFALPFFFRNLLLPMVGDDFSYAFIWDGEHWGNLMDGIGARERIGSFRDIVVSQWSHYFTWGGRTPSMVFIQFFAWVGKVWFDVVNTVVFVLLMFVLYWLSTGSVQSPARHKGVFLWVMLCMLFGVLDYPSTMLWMTGACVYLWTGLWECLFLLLLLNGSRIQRSTRRFPAFLLTLTAAASGLLAGWSEEAGSIVTAVLAAYILYKAWQQRRLERWMVVGGVFLFLGCLLLLCCPGSLHREQLMLELAPEYVLPADKLFTAEMFLANFTEGFLPILVWESFLFIPIVLYGVRHRHFHPTPSLEATEGSPLVPLFTAGSLLVLFAMLFAPEFAVRTGFHSTLFLTIASGAALKSIAPWLSRSLTATPLRRFVTLSAGSCLCLYALLVLAGVFCVETSYRQQFDSRLDYVLQHKTERQLVVPSFQIPYGIDRWLGPRSLMDLHLIYAADLESKSTDNRSLMYAQYYGLPPIRIDRQVDWHKRNGE